MSNFNLYAQYYDLLYKDKDYKKEAEYIVKLIKQFAPNAKSILNLGCGTGKHDFELAKLGYSVHGVDMSAEMISIANNNNSFNNQLSFSVGDIRNFEIDRKFDVVISLFHVMSYQNTNEDLLKAYNTAKKHLSSDGYFIFDCWYGPGVLTDPPVTRIKRISNEKITVLRIAESNIYPQKNVVEVNYEVQVVDNTSGTKEIVKEIHNMRYIFDTDVEFLNSVTNFKNVAAHKWMSFEVPTVNTWNTVFVNELL